MNEVAVDPEVRAALDEAGIVLYRSPSGVGVMDVGRPGEGDGLESYLDTAREALQRAMQDACEVLPEASAFAFLVHALWDEHRPAGALAPRRIPIPAPLRALVMERDEHACAQCGATDELQIDHIIPVSKGGPTDEDNLQVLCGDCNRKKRAS